MGWLAGMAVVVILVSKISEVPGPGLPSMLPLAASMLPDRPVFFRNEGRSRDGGERAVKRGKAVSW